MKGACVPKPPKPRYSETWDPTKVLDFLSTLFPNWTLSFDKLSKKLVVLLALITAQRSQALSLIKLDNINFLKEEVRIKILDRHKTSGLRQKQPLLILPSFPGKPSLCPVDTLREYLTKSEALRPSNDPFLFIATKAPYNHISSPTMSRWIKAVLIESGIKEVFSGYLTRHASKGFSSRNITILSMNKTQKYLRY